MKSKAPLIMMEQMVMLLVFALASALCLQAFVRSDDLSAQSEARDRAVTLCQSMAEELRSNGGSAPEAAQAVLGDHSCDTGLFRVPLKKDMTPAFDQETDCYLEVLAPSETVPGLGGACVVVRSEEETLFSLEVRWQEEVRTGG